ncbi:MAG: 2TM domain-containing protein [Promethearchaeota archaeon]
MNNPSKRWGSTRETSFSEETIRKIAREKVKQKIILQIHFVVYVTTNLFLAFINYLTIKDVWWAAYPALGWLIGLGLHAMYYVTYAKGVERGKVYFALHAVAFALVNGLLIFTNWNTDSTYWWAIWPLSCWGPALCFHLFFTIRNPFSREKDSYFDRVLNKELEKIQKRMNLEK